MQNFWVKTRECFYPKLTETPVQYNKVTSSLDFLQGLNLQRSFPTPPIVWKKINIELVIAHELLPSRLLSSHTNASITKIRHTSFYWWSHGLVFICFWKLEIYLCVCICLVLWCTSLLGQSCLFSVMELFSFTLYLFLWKHNSTWACMDLMTGRL